MDPSVPIQNLVKISLKSLKCFSGNVNLKRGADFFESEDLIFGKLKMFHVKHL